MNLLALGQSTSCANADVQGHIDARGDSMQLLDEAGAALVITNTRDGASIVRGMD